MSRWAPTSRSQKTQSWDVFDFSGHGPLESSVNTYRTEPSKVPRIHFGRHSALWNSFRWFTWGASSGSRISRLETASELRPIVCDPQAFKKSRSALGLREDVRRILRARDM